MTDDAANELPDDWWLTEHVAHFLSVEPSTVSAYVSRHQMPEPDRYFGRVRAWKPATIQDWHEGRRSQRSTNQGKQ